MTKFASKPVVKVPTKPRTCLRCRESFDSTGPSNRICEACSKQPIRQRCPAGTQQTVLKTSNEVNMFNRPPNHNQLTTERIKTKKHRKTAGE